MDNHAERFDLFHETQPFMQDWKLPNGAHDHHWSLISSEHGSYATNFLFGTKKRIEPLIPEKQRGSTSYDLLGEIAPAQAARFLLQHLSFSLGGRTTGVAESQADSPSASVALVLAQGDDLHETFCLNLLPYSASMIEEDLPAWEWMAKEGQARFTGKHVMRGYADRYTWMARGVRLQLDPASGHVGWLAYGGGVSPITTAQGQYLEPMAAYLPPGKEGEALRSVRLDPDKLLWRDLTALLPGSPHPPLTVANAAQVLERVRFGSFQGAPQKMSREERLARLREKGRKYAGAIPLSVFGLARSQQKIDLYRHEEFTLPATFVDDPQRFTNLVNAALEAAETVGLGLRRAVRLLCWFIVTTEADRGQGQRSASDLAKLAQFLGDLPESEGEPAYKGKEVAKKVARLSRQLETLSRYWSVLEPDFRTFLFHADEPAALPIWHRALLRAADDGWKLALEGVGNDAPALRAAAHASRFLSRQLKPIRQQAQMEVPA
ncbi:type I-E CRISPR-associated protein Cse1/CasA [Deinococcus aquaedulcis]|uniref:type I-E CRISPR-associated protein Cse1/CasA n=1 Tax=Deinococcus aquaedulcis TaxID=2840455 RepID=UPI001C82DC34|nr:type I-E CRISPR-associated protein Cse1/CasA [Deinococcus aquaedulcis]